MNKVQNTNLNVEEWAYVVVDGSFWDDKGTIKVPQPLPEDYIELSPPQGGYITKEGLLYLGVPEKDVKDYSYYLENDEEEASVYFSFNSHLVSLLGNNITKEGSDNLTKCGLLLSKEISTTYYLTLLGEDTHEK